MNWLTRLLQRSGHAPLPVSWEDLVADASSRDGFARERAVIALARTGNGAALAICLVRANDWVPQVRHAARAAIGLFLTADYIDVWAASLPQVVALSRAARADHSQLLQHIRSFMSTPEHLGVLRNANRDPSRDVARFLFSLELDIPLEDEVRFQQLREAVVGRDIVAAFSAIGAISVLTPQRQVALAEAACSSDFGSVRASGLREVLRRHPPGHASHASPVVVMCRDASSSVRAIALAALTDDRDRERVAEEMRATLLGSGSSKARSMALDVLCVLKTADALSLCTEASSDPASVVRYIAITRRLASASQPERDALILAALKDDSARIGRVALVQIKRGAPAPDVGMLMEWVSERPQTFGLLARVAVHLSPWDRVRFLLAALADAQRNAAVTERFHQEISDWEADMTQCFVVPSAGQVAEIGRLWAALRDSFPMYRQTRLADQFRAFGVF